MPIASEPEPLAAEAPDLEPRFFDASALSKRYVAETDSEHVQELLEGGMILAIARLTEVEVASALARRCREGAFSAADRDRALRALTRDLDTFYIVEMSPRVTARAVALLARTALRAADAVQLASCLELREALRHPCTFVCYDERLLDAARGEGLATAP